MKFKYGAANNPVLRTLMQRLNDYRGFGRGEAIRYAKFVKEWDKKIVEMQKEMKTYLEDAGKKFAEMSNEEKDDFMKPYFEREFEIDMKPFRIGNDLKLSPNEIEVAKDLLA